MRTIIIFCSFLLGCTPTQTDCPQSILDNDLCEKFCDAKWEVYKLYCSCLEGDNSLQQKLLFNDIVFQETELIDSIFMFYFDSDFISKLASDKKCFYYNGIGYLNDKIEYYSRGDFALLDYSGLGISRMDSIMNKVLLRNRTSLHPWIKKQVKIRNVF